MYFLLDGLEVKGSDYMLTIKQEKFVNNLVKGLSQRKAYRAAFPNSKKWKDETVDNKASKLFNSDEVKARYEELHTELKSKMEAESIMTVTERMKWLSDVIKGNVTHTSYDEHGNAYDNEAYISDKLKAVDTMNKMEGIYVNNHKVSGDKDNPLNIVDLSHLTTEQIRELLDNEDKE